MVEALVPTDEAQRLAELDQMQLLDMPPEEAFDKITAELASIFDVPFAAMSLIDRDREFHMSQFGLAPELGGRRERPRGLSLCAHVVGTNEMLIVHDLSKDARFADNPMIVASGARFYAGTPLRTASGRAVGSLCIVDHKPRDISVRETGMLRLLADTIMTEVKLRSASRELRQISRHLVDRNRLVEAELNEARIVQELLLPPTGQRGKGYSLCYGYHPFDRIGGDFIDVLLRGEESAVILLADVSGHGASAALTSVMTKLSFVRYAATAKRPQELLTGINADLGRIIQNGRFMTAIAAIYDIRHGTMELASAGHPYPFIMHGAEAEILNLPNELPMLIEESKKYSDSHTIKLNPNDRLVLYTDGAIEAGNGVDQFLGFEGLERILKDSGALRGDAFLTSVYEGIARYAAKGLADDVALLSLECLNV